MRGLFIRVYLDEDVSVIAGRMLRGRGFEAVTTHEAGRVRVPVTAPATQVAAHA